MVDTSKLKLIGGIAALYAAYRWGIHVGEVNEKAKGLDPFPIKDQIPGTPQTPTPAATSNSLGMLI